MKWSLVFMVAAAAGCQSQESKLASAPSGSQATTANTEGTTVISLPKAQVTDAYKADINSLCDAIRLSGAEQKPKDERWTHVAMWLGPQIKTPEGHEFLVAINPLKGEAKALALETEAKRVGLAACPLADEWRRG